MSKIYVIISILLVSLGNIGIGESNNCQIKVSINNKREIVVCEVGKFKLTPRGEDIKIEQITAIIEQQLIAILQYEDSDFIQLPLVEQQIIKQLTIWQQLNQEHLFAYPIALEPEHIVWSNKILQGVELLQPKVPKNITIDQSLATYTFKNKQQIYGPLSLIVTDDPVPMTFLDLPEHVTVVADDEKILTHLIPNKPFYIQTNLWEQHEYSMPLSAIKERLQRQKLQQNILEVEEASELVGNNLLVSFPRREGLLQLQVLGNDDYPIDTAEIILHNAENSWSGNVNSAGSLQLNNILAGIYQLTVKGHNENYSTTNTTEIFIKPDQSSEFTVLLDKIVGELMIEIDELHAQGIDVLELYKVIDQQKHFVERASVKGQRQITFTNLPIGQYEVKTISHTGLPIQQNTIKHQIDEANQKVAYKLEKDNIALLYSTGDTQSIVLLGFVLLMGSGIVLLLEKNRQKKSLGQKVPDR